ncbi:MAG: 4-carboxymuconolactone decarboxylase [Proteobacteria bacterium]|nr:4-carboxymuconolactone decarboxylase [Pseudomonadota bacterium]MBT4356519.1 4-carboxymuconolactone decarboxylase [Pseudomonadota bacterium]MBT4987900.1 4-carboxymuconolactone decarboxylase [Pseudomonadota bacterium]MBT5189144.1 4-carboxymuconolactone decarboxylase [Pseudomonadota bacterium]MBT5624667.1 4-carboxymuconolactone decarboxylase [Pseudomonadota bacterium]
MDKERFEKGLAVRSDVLGAEYVKNTMENASEFSRDFQELLTEYCWGAAWGDDTLDRKTRSMLNVTMIAALNRMHEWELHFRGAMVNGVSRDELKAILNQIAIYCGVPVAVECHRIAKKVFAELDGE